jgi:hypothetical protein
MICARFAACLLALVAVPLAAQQRIPIDLGPAAPTAAAPPQQIDLLSNRAGAMPECEQRRAEAGTTGEIVVCGEHADDSARLITDDAERLKDYAERTQNAGTLPPPDVAGPGIFTGPATIGGLCFIPPCPKGPAVIIDVAAIPPLPAGSDAERVAQGLAPVEGDDAPLDDAARRRINAELGLPPAPPRSR